MGAVLSLPFFRRRTRRRRIAPASTPISHPRPLLRRIDIDADLDLELEFLTSAGLREKVGRSASSGSRSSRVSAAAVAAGSLSAPRPRGAQRVRERSVSVGVGGAAIVPAPADERLASGSMDVSQPIAEAAEAEEAEAADGETIPSIPSLQSSGASDTTRDSIEPKSAPASRDDHDHSPPLALQAPQIEISDPEQTELALELERAFSPSASSLLGSKRRPSTPGSVSASIHAPSRTRRRAASDTHAHTRRNSLIIGTKRNSLVMTPAVRRASTMRKQRRRLDSGWDLIRHEEADGWAPAAGKRERVAVVGARRVRVRRYARWP